MQMREQRSKPLTRVFCRTRAGADVQGESCTVAVTCTRAIARGDAVLVHVVGEAVHVVDSTCVEAGG
jgi:hypothetical protein